MSPELKNLTLRDVEAACSVLARAFEADPLINTFFADCPIPPEQARLELFRYSCLLRFELGWPILGVVEGGRICAVGCISYPEFPGWTANLEQMYANLKGKIGEDAARKLDRYSELVEAHRPEAPHHFLAVLGVNPEDQGRGFGRRMLEEIQAQAAAHPSSCGVALDTENPDNLSFYEHFGYRLTAESTLEEIKIFHFFRPNAAE